MRPDFFSYANQRFAEELTFRLDVSQYYVIRTIIIFDASVGGHGVREFLKDDAESPAVPPCKSPTWELTGSGSGKSGRGSLRRVFGAGNRV